MVYNCVIFLDTEILPLCRNESSHDRSSAAVPPPQSSRATMMFAMNISTSRTVMFGNRYTGSPASMKLATKQKWDTAQKSTKANKTQLGHTSKRLRLTEFVQVHTWKYYINDRWVIGRQNRNRETAVVDRERSTCRAK